MELYNYEHRKGKVVFKLTDAAGNPLKNRSVHAELMKHEFLFGAGGFDFIPYQISEKEEERKQCEKRVNDWLAIFNYCTLPFYWGQFEPVEGKPNTEKMKKIAEFLNEHNVTIKGHPLCWHTVCANWLLKYSNEEILEKQIQRIYRETKDFKGLINMWDVINEVVIMPEFDKYDNAVTRICKDLGRIKTIKTMFDAARVHAPNAMLLLNDFNLSEKYENLIEECLNAGVSIDAIGVQTHQHQGYIGAERIYDIIDRFSKFNLPIHFTENTLISGDIMPSDIVDLNDYVVDSWPSTPEGEERQKREMEEMYRILFSSPAVEAVTMWDFTDGEWLGAPSGIVRKDGTRKPAYDMLRHLIKEEWHTDTVITTDENGMATLNGYRGEYRLTSDGIKAEAIVGKKDSPISIALM